MRIYFFFLHAPLSRFSNKERKRFTDVTHFSSHIIIVYISKETEKRVLKCSDGIYHTCLRGMSVGLYTDSSMYGLRDLHEMKILYKYKIQEKLQ